MAQKKPAGKPIKITLTEQQIADIIQRAAKTRRNVRVESLEDRIAPSRIGLPIFGGAEGDIVKDDADPLYDPNHVDPLNQEHVDPLGTSPSDGLNISTDGSSFDPYAPSEPLPPNPEDFVYGDDPNLPGAPQETTPEDLDPNLSGDPGPIVDPNAPVEPETLPTDEPVAPEEIGGESNEVFNDPLHVQGEQPEGAPSPEELEEHRLNILRQLRASN